MIMMDEVCGNSSYCTLLGGWRGDTYEKSADLSLAFTRGFWWSFNWVRSPQFWESLETVLNTLPRSVVYPPRAII